VESWVFFTDLHWLEEGFWASNDLVSDGDWGSIWKNVRNILSRVVTESLELGIEVKGNKAMLFFDFSGDFLFRQNWRNEHQLQSKA